GVAIDAGAMRGRSSMAVAPVPSASPLRAGSTDDNADLAAYTAFVDEWSAPGRLRAPVDRLDISDARTIQVTDPVGRPVPGARVSVTDLAADRIVWTGTTYGDGTAPWYPNLRAGLLGEAPVDGSLGYAVQAEHGGVFTTRQVGSGTDTVRMVLDESASGPTQLDVVFLLDTTGSMGDEIDRIKSTLLSTTARVRSLDDDVDLRYGAVLYRDIGDEYVTRAHPLTGDIQGFDAALQAIRAGGGGDGPESLNQGLAVAVDTMEWREDAARLVFVVADAPPHMDYQGDVTYGRSALAALHKGIRIHTVAASGLDDHGSLVFRQTAQLSQGHFIFIEYGSAAASAADHGVRGSVQSNNLDDILYRKIEAEVTGWGGDAGLAVRHRR
ncbi:MAG: VWA domain-containing protein, partial [Myxococcota bacterium]|nr:VWA domain-containing protein [Myxococcota bacterium]